MPKLFTNEARSIVINRTGNAPALCVSSYDQYLDQRIVEADATKEKIENLTRSYKASISDPIHAINSNIEMGEYFVIPVKELREMLNNDADKAEFLHVCNAMRSITNTEGVVKRFPVAVLVPIERINKDGEDIFEVCQKQDSVYIEAYPCPPHPNCPRLDSLKINVFDVNTKFNTFEALI